MSRHARHLPLVGALVLVLAACGNAGPTAGPTGATAPGGSGSPPASSPASPDLTPVPGGASPSGATTTTETEWGTILDALPPGFPTHPEAIAADPVGGPASGAFVVGASGVAVTEWYQAALELAGYSTVALSGPFEDGTTVIDSVGPESTACRVQTTITPRSGTTSVTILYDAACRQ